MLLSTLNKSANNYYCVIFIVNRYAAVMLIIYDSNSYTERDSSFGSGLTKRKIANGAIR